MGVITLLVLFPWLYLPDAGKIEGKRRRGQQRMRWLDSLTGSMHMDLSKFWEIVEDRGSWYDAVYEAAKSQTRRVTEQQRTIPGTYW